MHRLFVLVPEPDPDRLRYRLHPVAAGTIARGSPLATAPPPFDLRVASLPARPAGAAFAMAGQEHALVRAYHRRPAALDAGHGRAAAGGPCARGAGRLPALV